MHLFILLSRLIRPSGHVQFFHTLGHVTVERHLRHLGFAVCAIVDESWHLKVMTMGMSECISMMSASINRRKK